MRIGSGISVTHSAVAVPIFGLDPDQAIRDLFGSGEEGAWYDPSDLSTLYQDAAGTTPVTGTGQPVGLMLDKSKGLTLGSELVTNGTFDTDISGWSAGVGATVSRDTSIFAGGGILVEASGSSGTVAAQTLTGLTVGRWYEYSADAYTPDGQAPNVATLSNVSSGYNSDTAVSTTVVGEIQRIKVLFQATSSTQYINVSVVKDDYSQFGTIGSKAYFDNVSFRELPGNHATQSTSTARPTLQSSGGLYYLDFDGVDDKLSSGLIDMSGITQISAWVATTKTTDTRSFIFVVSNSSADAGVQAEHSGTIFGGSNGAYKSHMRRGSGNTDQYFSGFVTPADYTGTSTNILSSFGDRSVMGNAAFVFRVDGEVPDTNLTIATGTYISNPADFEDQTIHIASAASNAIYLDGRIYGLIIRSASSTTAEIEAAESYLAAKSGVTLP